MRLECKSCYKKFDSISIAAKTRNNQICYPCPECNYNNWSTFKEIKRFKK